ncbi:MAG: SGNH/GDSL hydrolase family protein [Longimicrobiaceae bacterium]
MLRAAMLWLLLALCGCSAGDAGLTSREPARFLALGDSYTIGEGVPEGRRWPVQLAERLRAAGVVIADPRIIAQTGWTVAELDAGMDAAGLRERFDLVTLLIGVNDQYRGYPLEGYRTGFRDLLARAVAFAGGEPGRVVVLSIPDWGVTPFARQQGQGPRTVAREIDRFNKVKREEAERAGARYVDVTGSSRRAADDTALLAPDGLHPSGEMYAAWVELVLPEAKEVLAEG